MSRVHPQARTTPRTRAEIRSFEAPLTVLAERYNVTKATVRKWRGRQDMQDRSHRPNTLSTTLTPAQEAVVVELRRTLLLPLDDLLALTHEFINRAASRSGLDRCLRRHGVSKLAELIPVVEGEPTLKKSFKDYEPGFLHVDIKYLRQMPDETHRRYLFVAIVWRWDSDLFGTSPATNPASGVAFTYNLRFPGQYLETESAVHYNEIRHYNPYSGRYIQADPLGLGGGFSRYAYVGGNPLSYTDPNGLVETESGNVPGGPWTPNPANKPGNFLGPKSPCVARWCGFFFGNATKIESANELIASLAS